MQPEMMFGTKEVAAKLKIEPRYLRMMLRKINGKAPGERYSWKPTDPFLKKLPGLIVAEEKKAAAKALAAEVKKAKKRLRLCPRVDSRLFSTLSPSSTPHAQK